MISFMIQWLRLNIILIPRSAATIIPDTFFSRYNLQIPLDYHENIISHRLSYSFSRISEEVQQDEHFICLLYFSIITRSLLLLLLFCYLSKPVQQLVERRRKRLKKRSAHKCNVFICTYRIPLDEVFLMKTQIPWSQLVPSHPPKQ